MFSMNQALVRIKANTDAYLPDALLHGLCRQLHIPFRNRLLTPAVTTRLFLKQVLHGNASVAELRRLVKTSFAESSYCEARGRLPATFLQRLHHTVLGHLRAFTEDDPAFLWRGRHRAFFIDGSSFSMPDTDELRKEFGQSGNQAEGCGFPTAHLLVQFEAATGYLLHAIPAPLRTHDLTHAATTHAALRPGDVLVGDRAFCSYAHLALLQKRGCFGVFRAHQRQIVSFVPGRPHALPGQTGAAAAGLPRSRFVRSLGKDDQLVEYFKPRACPSWLSREEYDALPETLLVRELRYRIAEPGKRVVKITLVTTLLDERLYPKAALACLYESRWGAEVNLRHLKQTLKMDVLRCGTVKGVWKEVAMFVVAYNLVRRVMVEAAEKQGVKPDRISFADALRWLRASEPGEELPRLIVNRSRPGRFEPRVKKRRPKKFKLLNRPRAELRAALLKPLPA